jgi:hypothetical protein
MTTRQALITLKQLLSLKATIKVPTNTKTLKITTIPSTRQVITTRYLLKVERTLATNYFQVLNSKREIYNRISIDAKRRIKDSSTRTITLEGSLHHMDRQT